MRTLIEGKTEQLECHLITDELLDRANLLALACQDIEREDGRQAQIKADMKATLARLEAEQSRLTLIVARKAEPREVRVTTYADDDKAEAITIRDDTGEIIRRRALDLSERQLRLPEDDQPEPDDVDAPGAATMSVKVNGEWKPATEATVAEALAAETERVHNRRDRKSREARA